MEEVELSPEEAETLQAVVRGDHAKLRARDLVKLNLMRLIMTRGTLAFEPTALGFEWYRKHKEERHGGEEEGSKQGSCQEGGPEEGGEA
ncbi:hypothetical protein [Reyranella massiliensis]|uniref:hypothetical protein n=1 Tax=Reyranella massiliensis TaxID=445220 RepID=UPI000303A6E8|nr:hypothetical protein [Reyranella massiliensis]